MTALEQVSKALLSDEDILPRGTLDALEGRLYEPPTPQAYGGAAAAVLPDLNLWATPFGWSEDGVPSVR